MKHRIVRHRGAGIRSHLRKAALAGASMLAAALLLLLAGAGALLAGTEALLAARHRRQRLGSVDQSVIQRERPRILLGCLVLSDRCKDTHVIARYNKKLIPTKIVLGRHPSGGRLRHAG